MPEVSKRGRVHIGTWLAAKWVPLVTTEALAAGSSLAGGIAFSKSSIYMEV